MQVRPVVALGHHVVLQVPKQAAPGAEELVLLGGQVLQVLRASGKGAVVAQEAGGVHFQLVVGGARAVQLVQLSAKESSGSGVLETSKTSELTIRLDKSGEYNQRETASVRRGI